MGDNPLVEYLLRGVSSTPDVADWPPEVLEARDRSHAAPTFSPAGLYLVRVEYDPSFQLPAPSATVPAWLDAYPDQDLRTDP